MDAPSASGPWTCAACGHANPPRPLCEACGTSRAWLDDPPLELAPPPALLDRPAGWLALLHGALALGGLALLLRPELAPALALDPPFAAAQVLASLAAAWRSLEEAVLERTFRAVELDAPARAAAASEVPVRARLVPYRDVPRARVELALLSNTYARDARREGGARLRSVVLERVTLPRRRLRGRREARLEARFVAPAPLPAHRDVAAELEASVLAALGPLVPGLDRTARNLREHGGFRVRLTVRVGPWRRRIERRLVVYRASGERFDIA